MGDYLNGKKIGKHVKLYKNGEVETNDFNNDINFNKNENNDDNGDSSLSDSV
jgi:hypothetical protein